MKPSPIAAALLSTTLLVGGLSVLPGCSCSSPEPAEESTPAVTVDENAVAATVRDTVIYERDVTAEIESMRDANGLTEANAWNEFLDTMGYEPETVRDQVLTRRINEELIRQEAAARSLTVSDEELTAAFDAERALYDSDEQWQAFLDSYQWTEESYRESMRDTLLTQRLQAALIGDAISDEDRLAQAQIYAQSYNGAKRSSRILFAAGDEATAANVKASIENGTLSFADAVAQYSLDPLTATLGGDQGWDVLAAGSYDKAVFAALATLEKDQLSDPITTAAGVELILVTDVFNAPAEVTDVNQLPEAFREAIDRALTGTTGADALDAWLAEQKSLSGAVSITPIPEGVPYERTSS